MPRNNADFSAGVGKFFAGASASGLYHVHTSEGSGKVKALCGAGVWTEDDGWGGGSPTARLDEEPYTPNSQFVECAKCEKALRKIRGKHA